MKFDIVDTRELFKENWILIEQPQIEKSFGDQTFLFDAFSQSIENRKAHYPVKKIHDVYSIGNSIVCYWLEKEKEIVVGMEVYKKSKTATVNIVAKNPKFMNQPPYAIDLYLKVLDLEKSITIQSDKILTESSLKIWKKLINNKNIFVFVYNTETMKYDTLDSIVGIERYFDKKYRFVLSKNKQEFFENISSFDLHAMRKIIGIQ